MGGMVLLTSLVGLAATAAAPVQCSLSVEREADAPLAYGPRGDRCEGLYRQRVANRINLRIVGYHIGIMQIPLETIDEFRISAGGAGFASVSELQVTSLRERVYYQMDTRSLSKAGHFIWKLDLLKKLQDRFFLRDLGMLACDSNCNVQNENAILAPIYFTAEKVEADDLVQVLVVADVELQSLTADLNVGGKMLLTDYRVGGRFLPAKRSQRLRLPQWHDREAELTLKAVTHNGQRDVLTVKLAPPVASYK